MNEMILYIFLALILIELIVVIVIGGKLAAQIGRELRKKLQNQQTSDNSQTKNKE